jgi:hydrogenase maturation protease
MHLATSGENSPPEPPPAVARGSRSALGGRAEGSTDQKTKEILHTSSQGHRPRIIVGCVGNVLRGDDGFGPAVASRLGRLQAGVEVVESGIGGIALLQELLLGCDGLVVVDAVDRGAPAGTVFAIVPDVEDYDQVPDMHLATPERVLSMAKGLGCLPAWVLLVGCQPVDAEALRAGLSAEVEGALDVAAEQVREVIEEWLGEGFAHEPSDR